MLIRSIRQLVVILTPIVLLITTLLVLNFYDESSSGISFLSSRKATPNFVSSSASKQGVLHNDHNNDGFDLNVYGKPVHEVFSVSTKKGRYFFIDMGYYEAYNPSILPHPTKSDTWIVVAQQQRSDVPNSVWFAQLVCEAKFVKGKLICTRPPLILPIAATASKPDACSGGLSFLNWNVGPHDARAFYGPSHPYVIYGSQSSYNCFGLMAQDLRILTDWGVIMTLPNDSKSPFRFATELQRPAPYGVIEKNWFLFWDSSDQMHAHYDIFPKRVFAQISTEGVPGPDLAAVTAAEDEKCMTRYMPKLAPSLESLHQATNSLKITLCKRHDPTCKPTDANTFIMTVFHHKTYYNWHGVYEPYIMLFAQSAPFALHAISQKPIWIHGRDKAPRREGLKPTDIWEETEMFYVTSISWKASGQTYHGYIDDVMFMSFGIEDKRAAAIDVVAGDVLDHLGLCAGVQDELAVSSSTSTPASTPDSLPGDGDGVATVDLVVPVS